MSRAWAHRGVLLALLFAFAAVPRAAGACDATCKRDMERCMATQCDGVARSACRRRCKPAAIRTLAYVLTECEDAAAGFVGRQELRIRRGDGDPVSVAKFGLSDPMPQWTGLCRLYGESRQGALSVAAGALQRLAVSPDGSAVVFEVNDELVMFPSTRVSPDQRGFFFVHSDGQGLRYLGPPSREPTFFLASDMSGDFNLLGSFMAFSPNGRSIAFIDRGPGPDGEDGDQIVVLDVETGKRVQVTRLPSQKASFRYPDSCCPTFLDNRTILFRTVLDFDGTNPEHGLFAATVQIDGSKLKPVPGPVTGSDSRIVPAFRVGGLATSLLGLTVPGRNGQEGSLEIFLQRGEHILQLTNFGRRGDTIPFFLNVARSRAFFKTTADPLKMNPCNNQQMFSINTRAGGLRQLTQFNVASGCSNRPACSIGRYLAVQDPVTRAVLFDSECDPLGANRFGSQVFVMRTDGLGLRQLTDAAGLTTNPDGSIRVELPGPFAYSDVKHF